MTTSVNGIPWNVIFISFLWSLWKSQNLRIFEVKCMRSEDIFQYTYKLSMDIKVAWSLNVGQAVKPPQWIKWERSPMGAYVINTDGSVLSDSGAASTGGLLKNNKGEWIRGFFINIGLTDSLNAEL